MYHSWSASASMETAKIMEFNLLQPDDAFLYPLKTSENL